VRTELLDVLDQCLVDIRAGRKTIERCLEEHSAHRAELDLLLRAAAAIVPSRVVPDPAAKLRARYAIVEAMHRDTEARPSGLVIALIGLRRRVAGVAAAMVLAVAGSGAAVVAAQDAQPNEPLYGLKTAVEQQQIAFAASPEARAQLRVQIATRRLAEAERAIESGREDAAIVAAAAYGETMQRAYDDMDAAQGAGRPVAEAHEAAGDSLARLQDVTARASTAGNREAAAALAAAAARAERERAERERPRRQTTDAPSRPTVQASAAVIEVSVPIPVALADDSESEAADAPPVPDEAATAPRAAAAAPTSPARPAGAPSTLAPAARGQGPGSANAPGNAANAQRGAPARADGRDDERDERGRGQGESGAGANRTGSQAEPTRAAPTAPRVLPTPTLQRSGGERQGSDDRGGANPGRGGDDNRERATVTRTPTAAPRSGTSGDERARPMPTSTTRSGSGDDARDRSGPNRSGNRDRDDDD